ncbi:MAG: thiamine phosphate synthase, partial [Clostridiales bacterium]|nr:thiamine phosphate synthase [Clostridiales bacterium]
MNCRKEDMLLYAVTDRSWIGDGTLSDQAEQALRGGVTLLQLREKMLSGESFFQEAVKIKGLCDRYGIPLIINDNVEIAKKTGAAGVHVGQKDMEAGTVRSILGPDKIIGVSARTVEQAVRAEQQGADYLGVGAVFSTGTKQDAKNISIETLKEICQAVSIPVVAIGGITKD